MGQNSKYVEPIAISPVTKNIRQMRFTLIEFSGGLGDLGTFIPLIVAVSIVTGMDFGVMLIFAGIFNILSGFLFGQPIPVQPMKAIAAVAIAEHLIPTEIAAAGLLAGLIIFLMAVTGMIEKIEKLLPISIIRGIQLGVGLKLALKGIEFVADVDLFGINSISTAVLMAIVVLLFHQFEKKVSALLLFFSGFVILYLIDSASLYDFHFSITSFTMVVPSLENWLTGFTKGTIPQLPLTLLNSVFAICILSGDLFPGEKISSRKMAASVGIMNLVGCWFGGFPMCHGSGGLAGQYYFGARTGGSVVMLGIMKLACGLFIGDSIMRIIILYPHSILGIMLFFSGYELAKPARDQKLIIPLIIVIATALGILLLNTLYGFLVGVTIFLFQKGIEGFLKFRAK